MRSFQQFLKVIASTVIVKTVTKRWWRKQPENQALLEFRLIVLSSGLTVPYAVVQAAPTEALLETTKLNYTTLETRL